MSFNAIRENEILMENLNFTEPGHSTEKSDQNRKKISMVNVPKCCTLLSFCSVGNQGRNSQKCLSK